MFKSLPVVVIVVLSAVGCSQNSGWNTSDVAGPSSKHRLESPQRARSNCGLEMTMHAGGRPVRPWRSCVRWASTRAVQDIPRAGFFRNVARQLYELGLIPDDTLQALGAFLSSALNLSIESCL